MSHIRIFDNPKGKWFRAGQFPPLAITGILPDYIVGEAYEGRLQIENAIGDCYAQLTSGSLPPGAEITVDQASDEIVITWPAYSSTTGGAVIANGDFEAGNTGWDLGASLEIGTWNWEYDGDDNDLQAYDGTKSVELHAGFRGNTRFFMATPAPCAAGTTITASCQVQQGPSARNHTGGWLLLQFLDAGGAVLAEHEGNHVISSDDAAWHPSTATATAPVGTAFARLGGEGFRRLENKPMWFDAFAWDLDVVAAEVGINTPGTLAICVRARDTAGREADWCGTITSAVWTTTLLHFNDVDGGTTFIDESGKIWTAFGDAQMDTSVAPPFGTSSGLFAGDDYISTPHTADLDFGTGDFTVECYVRPTSIGTQQDIMTTWGSSTTGWSFVVRDSGLLGFWCTGDTADATGATVLDVDEWIHVAACRHGNKLRLFAGGQLDGTITNTDNIASTAQATIGAFLHPGAINDVFGRIKELRVTKGFARYTFNFTPPVAEFDYP